VTPLEEGEEKPIVINDTGSFVLKTTKQISKILILIKKDNDHGVDVNMVMEI
jgi:hypothetical protein